MADTKLSALTPLTAAGVAPATDLLYIDDVSVTTSKSITVNALAQSMIVMGTEQASTSGTEIDFTGIPAGVKRIAVMLKGVSTNGTSNYLFQLGDAGGPETSGYLGSGSVITTAVVTSAYTTGIGVLVSSAAAVTHGTIIFTLEDASDFTWTCAGNFSDSAGISYITSGSKSLSAELTQVRITTVNGTDAFDAGAINISYT